MHVINVFSVDTTDFCNKNPKAIAANPLNCAQYIDCSRTGPFGVPHVFECPYPDLFNNNTLSCDNFENVNCGRRMEPMDPCMEKFGLIFGLTAFGTRTCTQTLYGTLC